MPDLTLNDALELVKNLGDASLDQLRAIEPDRTTGEGSGEGAVRCSSRSAAIWHVFFRKKSTRDGMRIAGIMCSDIGRSPYFGQPKGSRRSANAARCQAN